MDKGHIIFLNGTTSSGKTTIAKALQENLSEPYLHVSGDDFISMFPQKILGPADQDEGIQSHGHFDTIISGLHKCVAALANSGNNIIVDHVLHKEGWLEECVENWQGLEVLFVAVKCPLEILEQRERERRDRQIGGARNQFERVHAHGLYDIEVDTAVLTADECVTRIIELVKKPPTASAFQEIANKLTTEANEISKAKEAG
jgi:chloramphenicol 3-O phosphotransferase